MSLAQKRRRIDAKGGSRSHPATWGLPLKFHWQATKRWADVLTLDVDPITLAEFGDSKKDVMEIVNGVYTLGSNATYNFVVILTTSLFDVQNRDDVSPMQLETDSDTIFRASSASNQTTLGLHQDMEILPDGASMVVVTPTIYAYAWRGPQSMEPNAAAPNEAIDVYCAIKLAYYMRDLNSGEKLDRYIAQSQNASFLEFIPEA